MILFVNDNSGILFIVTTAITEIWKEIIKLYSTITKTLNIDSQID